jgi:MFS family permease
MDRRRQYRPTWSTATWWRQPAGPIYFATFVASMGKGAWYTCWALFFIRSIGLSPAQFGIGVTVAGVLGLVVGSPLGYLADRVGPREVLIALAGVHALVMFAFIFVRNFWALMVLVCVMVAADRSIPGIRTAAISGLATGDDRLNSISTAQVMKESGQVLGALVGAVVLSVDTRAGYLGMLLFYAVVDLVFVAVVSRVPHLESLGDRKVKRRILVLRDRPFMLVTLFNGLLALNWGMLESGVPLWMTTHTNAPPWILGLLMGGNGIVLMMLLNRVTRAGRTVAGAGRLGLWSGILLACSCGVFALTDHGSGTVVLVLLAAAAAVHVLGELFFLGSGFGLSVGLTPDQAHGEYQGLFSLGQGTALMIAPGIMAVLLVSWGVAGWFALAGLYLAGGVGTVLTGRWALHTRRRPDESTGTEPGELRQAA